MNGLRATVSKLVAHYPASIVNDFSSLEAASSSALNHPHQSPPPHSGAPADDEKEFSHRHETERNRNASDGAEGETLHDGLRGVSAALQPPGNVSPIRVNSDTHQTKKEKSTTTTLANTNSPCNSDGVAVAELAELLVSQLMRLLSTGLYDGVDIWPVLETLTLIPAKVKGYAATAVVVSGAAASSSAPLATTARPVPAISKGTVVEVGHGTNPSSLSCATAQPVPSATPPSAAESADAAQRHLVKRLHFASQLIRTVESMYPSAPSLVRARVFLRLALNYGCLCSSLELIARHNRHDIAPYYQRPELSFLFHYKPQSLESPSPQTRERPAPDEASKGEKGGEADKERLSASHGDLWEQFIATMAPAGGVPLSDIEHGATKGFSLLHFKLALFVPGLDDDLSDYTQPPALVAYLLSQGRSGGAGDESDLNTRSARSISPPPPAPSHRAVVKGVLIQSPSLSPLPASTAQQPQQRVERGAPVMGIVSVLPQTSSTATAEKHCACRPLLSSSFHVDGGDRDLSPSAAAAGPRDGDGGPVVACFYHRLGDYLCGLTHTAPPAAQCVRIHRLAAAWQRQRKSESPPQVTVQVIPVGTGASDHAGNGVGGEQRQQRPSRETRVGVDEANHCTPPDRQQHQEGVEKKRKEEEEGGKGTANAATAKRSKVKMRRRRRALHNSGTSNGAGGDGDGKDGEGAASASATTLSLSVESTSPASQQAARSSLPLSESSLPPSQADRTRHHHHHHHRRSSGHHRHRSDQRSSSSSSFHSHQRLKSRVSKPTAEEAMASFEQVKGQWAAAVVEKLKSDLAANNSNNLGSGGGDGDGGDVHSPSRESLALSALVLGVNSGRQECGNVLPASATSGVPALHSPLPPSPSPPPDTSQSRIRDSCSDAERDNRIKGDAVTDAVPSLANRVGQRSTPPPLLARLAAQHRKGQTTTTSTSVEQTDLPMTTPSAADVTTAEGQRERILRVTRAPPLVRTLKAMRRASGLHPSDTNAVREWGDEPHKKTTVTTTTTIDDEKDKKEETATRRQPPPVASLSQPEEQESADKAVACEGQGNQPPPDKIDALLTELAALLAAYEEAIRLSSPS